MAPPAGPAYLALKQFPVHLISSPSLPAQSAQWRRYGAAGKTRCCGRHDDLIFGFPQPLRPIGRGASRVVERGAKGVRALCSAGDPPRGHRRALSPFRHVRSALGHGGGVRVPTAAVHF